MTLFLIDKTLAIIFLKTPTCFYHFAHLGAHSNLIRNYNLYRPFVGLSCNNYLEMTSTIISMKESRNELEHYSGPTTMNSVGKIIQYKTHSMFSIHTLPYSDIKVCLQVCSLVWRSVPSKTWIYLLSMKVTSLTLVINFVCS